MNKRDTRAKILELSKDCISAREITHRLGVSKHHRRIADKQFRRYARQKVRFHQRRAAAWGQVAPVIGFQTFRLYEQEPPPRSMKRLGELALKIGLEGMDLFDVDPPVFGHDFSSVRHPQDFGNQIHDFFGCGAEH